ncbi:MAG: hypothetical protein A3A83_01020 [Candidatus Doudnabacteria bacterium RIFCSPLOWO2_01_FULL_48_57]|nr:MAG: hypothetical protein A3F44_02000 [Candidatus Doudnabacteria bacterium RIFCSPHIGHO2_12_FULL_47_25]OGE97164.1 MAG: hypothetical protein A3A83_01020 [Candidatus Doudnabacteria bacterium RIFCSPLOWO2_01_FULL_48_57]
MDLSVVIVSFNTKEKLRECLRSVFGSVTKYSFEVLVVDNNSRDGSAGAVAAEFPNMKLIRNSDNVGYSKANNQALRLAQGSFFLLLNSDVEVAPDSFDKMISYMDNEKAVGIVGCRVIKSDGSFDKAARRSFPDLANSLRHFLGLSSDYNLDLPEDKIAEVDSVMGAFLMIRREVVDKIGLLDEAFFMYGEDLDWCFRAKQAGYKVVYNPATTVVHHKGSSSRKLPKKALYEFHRAMFIFYDKHYAPLHGPIVNYLVKLGIWGRYHLKVFQNLFRKDKYVSK